METKELKITIPEGQEIDWQESAKQKKIVFKKKDTKPRSWKEYCEQQAINNKIGFYINHATCFPTKVRWTVCEISDKWGNVLPSKELAEAFLAMMQLVSLRQAWVGDWKPNKCEWHWCIFYDIKYEEICSGNTGLSHTLEFPTEEMAEEFLNCFKDLLEIAKPLL